MTCVMFLVTKIKWVTFTFKSFVHFRYKHKRSKLSLKRYSSKLRWTISKIMIFRNGRVVLLLVMFLPHRVAPCVCPHESAHGPKCRLTIYTYKTWILSVCLCVCVFAFSEAAKSPSFMKFWLKASFGPGWSMTKPDFRNFDFYGFYGHFSCFLKCVF